MIGIVPLNRTGQCIIAERIGQHAIHRREVEGRGSQRFVGERDVQEVVAGLAAVGVRRKASGPFGEESPSHTWGPAVLTKMGSVTSVLVVCRPRPLTSARPSIVAETVVPLRLFVESVTDQVPPGDATLAEVPRSTLPDTPTA